jgi:hypothetical protein
MIAVSMTFDEADRESEWKDLEDKAKDGKLLQTEGLRVLMTPGGMTSGAPSLTFRFDCVDGTVVVARISLGNLLGQLVPAIRGRLAFLGIDEAGKPTAKPDASKN